MTLSLYLNGRFFIILMLLIKTATGQAAEGFCSLEGCSPQHDSWTDAILPSSDSVTLQWSYIQWSPLNYSIHNSGASCSGNGDLTLCSLNHTTGVVALNVKGELVWSSQQVFGSSLFADFAPVIDSDGCSAVQDGFHLIYFSPTGQLLWGNYVANEGDPGSLFSQGSTNNGYLPTHLGIGSIAIFETATGLCWASMQLGFNDTTETFYSAVATVATSNERTYVPTTIHTALVGMNSSSQGALFCVLSTHDQHERFKVQWSWPCHPVPYQAPTVFLDTDDTVIVMFFGTESQSRDTDTVFLYALRDSTKPKTMPTLLWRKQIDPSSLGIMVDRAVTNGGAWLYESSTHNLLLLELSTGNIVRTINLIAQNILRPPISFGTLGISSNGDTILIACFGVIDQIYSEGREKVNSEGVIVAINLSKRKELWRFTDTTTGQIVPMKSDTIPLVVYKNIESVIQAIA